MSEKTLSQKVEALIQDGMTGSSIAERAGCDSSTISRIRRGQIGNPAYSVGIAIDQMHAELVQRKAAA